MSTPDLSPIIASAAQRYNLDPELVAAVVARESTGNPAAQNPAGGGQGAWGAMQVRAPALADYNKANGTQYKVQDLTDPKVGIDVGSWYLDQQLQKFPDPAKALTAYNQGAASDVVQTGGSPYASAVLNSIGANGAAAGAHPGAANVLASFGFDSSGRPVQVGNAANNPAPAVASAGPTPAQSPAVGGSKSPAPAGADVLAKFGFGPDGKPMGAPEQQTGTTAPAVASAGPTPAQSPAVKPANGGFGPIPGDQTANAQEGEEAASQAQGEFGQGLLPGANSLVGGAFQTIAHGASAAANTFAGGSPLAQALARWSAAEDAGAKNNAAQVPNTPSGHLGEFAGQALTAAALPGGTAAKAIASGALAGAAQPVTQNADQNFWAQKGVQTALGAATGGATDLALKGIGSVVQRVAPSEPEVLTRLRNYLQGQQIEAQAQPDVAGVQPTLAELTGNQNLGVAQRQFAQANPQPFQERAVQNAAARENAFSEAAGSPYEAEQAAQAGQQRSAEQYAESGVDQLQPDQRLADILQRPSMQPVLRRAESLAEESGNGNPFEQQRQDLQGEQNQTFAQMARTPEDIEAAREARSDAVADDYNFAESQAFPVDSELAQLLQRPSFTRRGVFQRAQNLADEQDAGPLITQNEDGSPSDISGQALHYIKQGLDDLLSNAKTEGIGANERRAILQTQNQLLDWFDRQSPEYASARANYEQMSQPINQMEYLQGLNVTDANGNVNLPKLDTAIKKTEQLRQSPRLNQAQALSDDQMQGLYQMRDTLRGAQNGLDVSRFNPQQIQYVQQALDDEMAKGTAGAAANQNDSLAQSRQDLENWLGARAPGYIASKQTAQAAQRGLETNQYMQKDISDTMGRLQLSRVEQKIKQIENDKRVGADTPAARVSDQTLEALRQIRDSFRVEKAAEATPKGSPTSQNLAAQQALGLRDQPTGPGVAGSLLAHGTGTGIGGAAGWGAGNLVTPGLGGAVGSAVGNMVGSALERRAMSKAAEKSQAKLAELIDQGTDMFLNPTPELLKKLNTTPGGQQLMKLVDMARARAPGVAGVLGSGPGFRGATQ